MLGDIGSRDCEALALEALDVCCARSTRPAHVMATVAHDIEVSECQRARALAGVMLQPARVIQKQRFRQARASHCFSCLRDSIEFCARQTRSEALLKDLAIVRRDVVRAGLLGSRR